MLMLQASPTIKQHQAQPDHKHTWHAHCSMRQCVDSVLADLNPTSCAHSWYLYTHSKQQTVTPTQNPHLFQLGNCGVSRACVPPVILNSCSSGLDHMPKHTLQPLHCTSATLYGMHMMSLLRRGLANNNMNKHTRDWKQQAVRPMNASMHDQHGRRVATHFHCLPWAAAEVQPWFTIQATGFSSARGGRTQGLCHQCTMPK